MEQPVELNSLLKADTFTHAKLIFSPILSQTRKLSGQKFARVVAGNSGKLLPTKISTNLYLYMNFIDFFGLSY